MRVKAIYENGVFKPRDPTGWKATEALIGFINDAAADMAEHHDEYLGAK